jgi:acyl-CoA hydrolase
LVILPLISSQVILCSSTAVATWSGRYSVTVSANGIRFIRPILVGQLITVTSRIVHTGKTSMHIYVVVRAEDPKENKVVVTHRCFITFMAIDEAGYPITVHVYKPVDEEDTLLETVAMHAKDLAKKLDQYFDDKLGWK